MTREEANNLPEGSIIVRGDVPLVHAEPIVKRNGRWHLLGGQRDTKSEGFELQGDNWKLDPDHNRSRR